MEQPKSSSDPAAPAQHADPKPIQSDAEADSVIHISDDSSSNRKIPEEGIGERKGTGTPKTVRWIPDLVSESHYTDRSSDFGYGRSSGGFTNNNININNPYVASSPVVDDPSASIKEKAVETMIVVKDVLGRWGKKVGEATKKAEDLAGNTWQHLKTAPSFTDAAMGRIAQGTKILAEGGYEKIFRQTFETVPEEKLVDSFACYLSTSAGPVMGSVYISTTKIAFCSDSPLSYKSGDQTEWSYYKVVIPLHQLKAVNPSSSRGNGAEKYIQVISVDNHEFWYMGFLNYDGAVKCFQDALENNNLQRV